MTLHAVLTQLKFLSLPFTIVCVCVLFYKLFLRPLQTSTCTHTKGLTHMVYTTQLQTKCKQLVIDRWLHPDSSVCMLIQSAGPASAVHSVHDELLHGSSFFLPSPSPLWPSGCDGKTSFINYLRVKTASTTCHTVGWECEGMSAYVSAAQPYGSAGMFAGVHMRCVSESHRNTLSDHFSCWVQSSRVAPIRVVWTCCSWNVRKLSWWAFSARLWNCLCDLFCVAQPPMMHFSRK